MSYLQNVPMHPKDQHIANQDKLIEQYKALVDHLRKALDLKLEPEKPLVSFHVCPHGTLYEAIYGIRIQNERSHPLKVVIYPCK